MLLIGVVIVLAGETDCKMVIWKEKQHELDDLQGGNDPMTMRDLHDFGLLKFFRLPGMREYVHLLEHMI